MRQSGAETLVTEEPYELIAHVRVCGGAGWVTTGSTRKPKIYVKQHAVWFLIGATHRGHQCPPALTLPQVRYGLSLLLLEVFCTPGLAYICRQVHRQLLRNELARFYHHHPCKWIPPRKLRRDIQ